VWDTATGEPLTPPLEHQDLVSSAAFSPDGTRVVTASKTARVWDVRPDTGALADWIRTAERSPFVLVNGVLVRRSDPHADTTSQR
jgi:WD40 repeat protein